MNKSFKSIWCEKTGTYVAAAELSRSKGKKSSSAVLAAGLGIVVGFFALSGSAFATDGSLQLCSPTDSGMSSGSAGTAALSCAGGSFAFSLNNEGNGTGGAGFGAATARVSGFNDGLLELKGDAGISMVGQVEMNGNKITGLAAGTESATSTDAVNGSQLFATDQKVQVNAANIAVNAANIATNTTNIAGNAASIASNSTNIASNATNISTIDGRVTNVEGSVTTLTQQFNSGSVGLVQQDATSAAISVAKDAGGLSVDFTGTSGARVLSGVADGHLGAGSLEAVNGSQLFATNQNVQANTTSIAANTANITAVDGRVNNVESSVTDLTQQLDGGSVGLVKQDATSEAITVAKDTGGTSVDFTGTSGARVLSGVGAGRLGADSQEAVNGSQLFATNQNVQANTNSIAANTANIAANMAAIVDMGGRVNSVESSMTTLAEQMDTRPPVVVDRVDSAVQYSGSQLATNGDASQPATASGDRAVAIGAGATASSNNSVALGAGSQTGNRDNIVSVGSVGNERAIANVADGVLDTDAVNKRQLDSVSASSLAYTDERINQVQADIADAKRDANGAAAAAMAVATLPQSVIPGRGMASAAVSNMDGESAVAVGISKVSENSRWVTKLAGTVNTRGNLGVSAGIGFHW